MTGSRPETGGGGRYGGGTVAALLRWVVSPVVSVGAVGAYPTWLLGGASALEAEGVAGAIVLAAMLASGLVISVLLRASLATAMMGVLALGMARMIVCLLAAIAAYWWTELPLRSLALWMGGFYGVALAGETTWLYRTMKRLWPAKAPQPSAGNARKS
ncbi:MAG: hypothetical protein ABFD92_14585 [Planctomycetaceae bacterium]|nr:hypothetical protein [Planctomycetaceae bacterium]